MCSLDVMSCARDKVLGAYTQHSYVVADTVVLCVGTLLRRSGLQLLCPDRYESLDTAESAIMVQWLHCAVRETDSMIRAHIHHFIKSMR